MAIKNVSITVTYRAYDTAADVYKTGDVANHTIFAMLDGTNGAATNAPAEVDATNSPGLHSIVLTAGETNGNVITLSGKSSTADIILIFPGDIITEQGTIAVIDTVADAIQVVTDALPDSGALTSLATLAIQKQIKGATGGKAIINAAGTQVQVFDSDGTLFSTLDRTPTSGSGPFTWTPTFV